MTIYLWNTYCGIFPTPPSWVVGIFHFRPSRPLQSSRSDWQCSVNGGCLTHRWLDNRLLKQHVLQEVALALLEATQSGRREIKFDLDPTDNIYVGKHQTSVDYCPNEEKKWKDSRDRWCNSVSCLECEIFCTVATFHSDLTRCHWYLFFFEEKWASLLPYYYYHPCWRCFPLLIRSLLWSSPEQFDAMYSIEIFWICGMFQWMSGAIFVSTSWLMS